jgi:hypothetical protein
VTKTNHPISLRFRVLASLGLAAALTSGCTTLDSLTGNQEMRWAGDKALSQDAVQAPNYKAEALLPDLNANQAARRFGRTPDAPAQKSDGETRPGSSSASGDGWQISVSQSPYSTLIRYNSTCDKNPTTDAETALGDAAALLDDFGVDSGEWSWFTAPTSSGGLRAFAEPIVEGERTWSTGAVSVVYDSEGVVCSFYGNLVGFAAMSGTTSLPSAYETFQEARRDVSLVVKGDYVSVYQSYTFGAEGVLIPLWVFGTADVSIVAVDLGDGLETAPDTRTTLELQADSMTNNY